MAKRQGGELNHDNWNADEVPEEAGQFRQAGQAALAGRVMKTARRRRPVGGEEGEGAPKSAFAGFGGFAKPVSTDATAAFSFIGKSPAEASSPSSGGFAAFGSAASSPSGGAFSFGSTASKVNFSQSGTESEPPAAKKPSVFGNFGAAEDQKSATASESKSSGFGAFSFGAKTEDKPPPQTQTTEAPKSDLMSMFKPTGWACDTCMVNNPTDKTACLSCETPKPGSKPVEKPASSSSAFSFGAVTSTASTGGFSFGAPSNKVEENKENNAGSGFSFGSKNAGGEKANLGGFQFGSKPAGDDAPVSNNGGFSFGAKSSSEETTKTAPTGGFSFGAKTSTEDPPKKAEVGSFSFGEKSSGDLTSSKPAAPSFSFGAKPAESAPSESFSFGNAFGSKPVEAKAPEKANSGSEFSFGQEKSTDTGSSKTTVAPAPLGSFAFGAAAVEKTSADVSEKKTAPTSIGSSSSENPSGFSFGATKASEKTSSTSATSFGMNSNSNSDNSVTQVDESSGSGSSGAGSPTRPPPSKEYLAHLKALNMQVASWINKHLEQNPLVLLTPVFKDYEKHLSEITEKYKGEAAPNKEVKASFPLLTTTSSSAAGPPITASTTSVPAFSLTAKSSEVAKPQSAFGGFGAASTEKPKPTSAAAPFSFGLSTGNNSSAPSLPAFAAFGSSSVASTTASSGFSFGNLASAPSTAAPAGDEDEDAPPVVEIKQVTEDDAKYSKKCKLFFKKDGSYVEKGVGMLYIKPVEGEKHQLLIRADTNLGNVLLNILLSSQIPTTRVGKNNVMLVCVPNPPVDPKQAEPAAPCPMLIRVKDGEAADELKAKIEECSGK